MSFVEISGFLSSAIGIYSAVPYIRSILNRKTKPHQLSWLVFVIMNGIVFFSQYFSGGRASVLLSLTFFVGSAVIFLLSLKFGVRNSSKWDKLLFAFALVTIVVWFVTKSNAIAIWLTLLIDLAATSMIILKIKSQPNSEDPQAWTVATLAYVFTCLTLVGQPLSILYVRPVYGFICDAAIVGFIYLWRKKSKKTKVVETSPLES